MTDIQRYDTVFLVGTGAEEGAWDPVKRAIQAADGTAVSGSDEANFWMAKLIALRRATYASSTVNGAQVMDYATRVHNSVRRAICRELVAAEEAGSLRVRQSFLDVLNEGRWGERKIILTTNWDMSLNRTGLPVARIHGSAEDSNTLFLPSDYAYDPIHAHETQQKFYITQDFAIRTLWSADKLCIYGLSLDPLDAELALIVATGITAELRELWVCNVAKEESRLRSRVALLVGSTSQIRVCERRLPIVGI